MSKFGIKEVADVTFFDISTGKPVLFFDTLKTSSIENTAESTEATGGRGNAKLITWNYSRGATMQMQDALLSMQSVAVLAGTTVKEGGTITAREVIKATAETATLENTPEDASKVVVLDADGKEVSGATVAETIVSGLVAGKKYSAYYDYKAPEGTQTVAFESDKFPSSYRVVGTTVVRDAQTGKDKVAQFAIAKAQLQAGFTFTMDAENVSTFDFNLDILRNGDESELYSLTVLE